MNNERAYVMSVGRVYPLYLAKVEKKGRTRAELDAIMLWLTGYAKPQLRSVLKKQMSFKDFFKQAPHMNPNRKLITGVICGVRIEEIKEPLMKEIRYLDKLVDELAHGRSMEKILRTKPAK